MAEPKMPDTFNHHEQAVVDFVAVAVALVWHDQKTIKI